MDEAEKAPGLMIRRVVLVLFVMGASAGISVSAWRQCRMSIMPVQLIVLIGSMLSLLWCAIAALGSIRVVPSSSQGGGHGSRVATFVQVARGSALLFAVLPVVVLSVTLVIRMVYVGFDLVRATPVAGGGWVRFGGEGLWCIAALLLASVIALASTRDRRLVTCALWLCVMAVLWWGLLYPALRWSPARAWERTGSTAVILAGLSSLLFLFAAVVAWGDNRRKWSLALLDPDSLTTEPADWPGLRQSFFSIAMFLNVLVALHLAVPIALVPGDYRLTMLIAAGSGGAGAAACFSILMREWSGPLADASLSLTTLALCSVAVSVSPVQPVLLAERYPTVFATTIIGMAVSAALFAWLAGVWRQQLDGTHAWTTAGRLIPYVKRFAFLNITLALLVSALLAVWPRLRGIEVDDDTFSAVTQGMWANLFLLLVALWTSRQLRRWTFHVLTVLAAVLTVGFVIMRMLPYTSRFG